MKKKTMSDYFTNWHKAILALLFFTFIGMQFMALALGKYHNNRIQSHRGGGKRCVFDSNDG